MYAIVETGGKQYRVREGDVLTIEKLSVGEGDVVELGRVLLLGGDQGTIIGTPEVAGAIVSAKILEQGRDKKKIVFRYKNKNRYSVKKGHRQPHTRVQIESILYGDREEVEAEAPVTEEVAADEVVAEPAASEPAASEPAVDEVVVEEPVVEEPVAEPVEEQEA